jgi:cytochrome c peroxidase
MIRFERVLWLTAVAVALAASPGGRVTAQSAAPAFQPPRGLQDMPIPVPDDNPLTAGKIALGEQLFFDKRLSRNDDMSCETCHVPEKGWTDGRRFSPKWDGSLNTRHSPTLYGVAYHPELYWDGRATKGLEAQIVAAWKGHMGGQPEVVAARLNAIPAYAKQFEQALGGPADEQRIAMALASFVRTIQAGDTPWDRMTQQERIDRTNPVAQGFKVFSQVAKCTLCHLPPLYTDTLYHNAGIGMEAEKPDLGRGGHLVAKAKAEGTNPPAEAITTQGGFKTPTLRGVALSAPYFHDGSAATLEEAVDVMLGGGKPNAHLDPKLRRWPQTPEQREQLLAFLKALTPDASYQRPDLP